MPTGAGVGSRWWAGSSSSESESELWYGETISSVSSGLGLRASTTTGETSTLLWRAAPAVADGVDGASQELGFATEALGSRGADGVGIDGTTVVGGGLMFTADGVTGALAFEAARVGVPARARGCCSAKGRRPGPVRAEVC